MSPVWGRRSGLCRLSRPPVGPRVGTGAALPAAPHPGARVPDGALLRGKRSMALEDPRGSWFEHFEMRRDPGSGRLSRGQAGALGVCLQGEPPTRCCERHGRPRGFFEGKNGTFYTSVRSASECLCFRGSAAGRGPERTDRSETAALGTFGTDGEGTVNKAGAYSPPEARGGCVGSHGSVQRGGAGAQPRRTPAPTMAAVLLGDGAVQGDAGQACWWARASRYTFRVGRVVLGRL